MGNITIKFKLIDLFLKIADILTKLFYYLIIKQFITPSTHAYKLGATAGPRNIPREYFFFHSISLILSFSN